MQNQMLFLDAFPRKAFGTIEAKTCNIPGKAISTG